eukprot:SAG31_NODE_11053_length_1070_cov_1.761071_1_plen_23_part_10
MYWLPPAAIPAETLQKLVAAAAN